MNGTTSSAFFSCKPGNDGGLPQLFTLQLFEADNFSNDGIYLLTTPRVQAQTAPAPQPVFYVTGLEPGRVYVAAIRSVNAKGRGKETRFTVFMPTDGVQRRTATGMCVKFFY